MSLSIVPPPQSQQEQNLGRLTVAFAGPAKTQVDLLRFNGGEFPKRQESLRLVTSEKAATADPGTRFFCLHIPHFAAWVALQANDMLRTVPFAIQVDGQVEAASPMARRCGVDKGQRIEAALKRCPQLRLIDQNLRQEIVAWQEIQREVSNLTIRVESVKMGFLVADVSDVPTPQLSRFTREWRVPAGIAHDRATAHLACLSAQPGEVQYVAAGHELEFLRTLPVTTLAPCGVPSAALSRMAWFGWNFVEALRALSFQQMEEQFGASASLLWRFACGGKLEENLREVPEVVLPESVNAHRNFQPLMPTYRECEEALTTLFRRALAKTGDQRTQTVELVVTTAMGEFKARRVLREPVARWGEGALLKLEPVGRALLRQALGGNLALTPTVYSLEIRLGGFAETEAPAVAERRSQVMSTRSLAA